MLKEIIIAIQSFGEAHRFIRRHNMIRWIWIPGIIYTIMFLAGIYLFWLTSSSFAEWIITDTGLKAWLESMGQDWLNMAFILAQVVIWITLLFFYFSIFKYLFLIFGAPLFAYLSEKTESIRDGKDFNFSFKELMKDVGRAVLIALRNLLWQSVYMIFILILTLIPVVGWASPVLSFFIESYYFGFSMLDYTLERNRLTASESIRFIGNHKGLAIGNGIVFFGIHLIPVIGWLMAPTYAVVAATLSVLKVRDDIRQQRLANPLPPEKAVWL